MPRVGISYRGGKGGPKGPQLASLKVVGIDLNLANLRETNTFQNGEPTIQAQREQKYP
jgi:hypothetical protein